ncbi:MAG: ArsR/SmtB family transcription factor [Chromatocurvus sp.]
MTHLQAIQTAVHNAAPADISVSLAALCKACADPLRLNILRALHNDSLGVSELCTLFDSRQPALSHHLKVLAIAGLVATRREGTTIFYRRSEPLTAQAGATVIHALLAELDSEPVTPAMRRGLEALQRAREENSRHFFRNNAHKFREQQDLIASYEQYADTVAALLAQAPIPNRAVALEVGPGDGRFLGVLGARFDRVIALDNAREMLDTSRRFAEQKALRNIEFILGDTASPAIAGLQADCVVINMVLHHTPRPEDTLAEAAGCLAEGGVLVVTDLCRHDQGWARENCGDLWLGFEPEQLTDWAENAGLADLTSTFLAQRNGFQIQVRLFGHRHT